MFDLERVRQEFPITTEVAFLNHAAAGPIPRRSQQAMNEVIDDYVHHALLHHDEWQGRTQRVREQSARLLNARPDQIAFIKNTSEGLSLAANGIDWRAGDNVVVPADDFPSVVYPWLNLAAAGVETRTVAARGGRVLLEDLQDAVDGRTRAIAISTVQFKSGFRSDLAAVGTLCRQHDLLFVVDGIQSLGALALDVVACGIDVVAADAHKWLLGPLGIGIFFCSDRALERLKVRTVGWLAVQDPYAFHYHLDLLPDARRFEPGSENAIGIYGLGGTLDLIEEVGMAAIEARVLSLTDQLCAGLHERGYQVLSPRGERERSGIVIFASPAHSTASLFERLSAERIVVSVRGGGIRVSPHYYNSEDEIAHVLETLP
jgi:cysteine desulfurase / selenocysteine lyase